jgi:hypothetical protein
MDTTTQLSGDRHGPRSVPAPGRGDFSGHHEPPVVERSLKQHIPPLP